MDGYLVVLGGNDLAIPGIKRLKEHGWKVLALDQNPQAPGFDHADAALAVDIFSGDAVLKALKSFKTPLCGVMAINDFGVETAALVAEHFGLPSLSREGAANTWDKVRMKQAWGRAGLKTPKFASHSVKNVLAGNLPEWSHYPCIVKPAFSGGGSRGVFLAESPEAVVEKLRDCHSAYLNGVLLMEEFIADATEHTAEVLIFGGETFLMSISDKGNYAGNVSIVQTLSFPGPIGNTYRPRLEKLLAEACKALELENGCAHFEVLIENDNIWLLEVGGRPGGGPNFHPIGYLSTGYDYPLEYGRIVSGKKPRMVKSGEPCHIYWSYFDVPHGVVEKIEGVESVSKHPNVLDVKVYLEAGKSAKSLDNDLCRPGYVMVRAESHDEAVAIGSELMNRIRITIQRT